MTRGQRIGVLVAAMWLSGLSGRHGAWADGAIADGVATDVVKAAEVTAPSVPYLTLLEGAASFDGKSVLFTGEAIGQVMERGAMAWVNVADSGGAIGLWMSAEAARSIGTLGSYWFRGDELRIRGTFRRACGEHGGDMDIHADTVEIVRLGGRVAHPLDATRLALAAALSLAAVAALLTLSKKDAKRRVLESSRYRPRDDGLHGA